MTDENTITFDRSVGLTVSGMIYSSWPPCTFAVHPDEPVPLADALASALKACGLEDQLEAVYAAMLDFMRPHFEKTVAEFEEMRQKAAAGEE